MIGIHKKGSGSQLADEAIFQTLVSRFFFIVMTVQIADGRFVRINLAFRDSLVKSLDQAAFLIGVAQYFDVFYFVAGDGLHHINQGEKVEERRIAKGIPPEDGTDGKPLYLVKKLTKQGEVKIDDRGFADYANLHLFDNVLKGQQVARIYPPKNGKDGKDALGVTVPSKPGKEFKYTNDKTLVLQDVNNKEHTFKVLVAETDGYLSDESGNFSIQEELFIKDNVDFKFGSIEFVGKVRVTGDVMQGFSISAKKGIEITGSVRGGSLIYNEGDIMVKGIVFGV